MTTSYMLRYLLQADAARPSPTLDGSQSSKRQQQGHPPLQKASSRETLPAVSVPKPTGTPSNNGGIQQQSSVPRDSGDRRQRFQVGLMLVLQ